MNILTHEQIQSIIARIACEISEWHLDTNLLVLVGLNSRGLFLAERLKTEIQSLQVIETVRVVNLVIESNQITKKIDTEQISNQHVVIVDDVINSGRSLMIALDSIFSANPASISTAFLAKREHRNFPVKADFVGISLATTLAEHVYFDNADTDNMKVFIE